MAAEKNYRAVGRRKCSSARVYLKKGGGSIVVNDVSLQDAFKRDSLCMMVRQPLEAVGAAEMFDIHVNVQGGGLTGQAQATRHGIARALVSYNETWRSPLRNLGFLTRDARIVERKKYGQRGARAKFQYTKR